MIDPGRGGEPGTQAASRYTSGFMANTVPLWQIRKEELLIVRKRGGRKELLKQGRRVAVRACSSPSSDYAATEAPVR